MRNSRSYILLGVSVVVILSLFVTFSEDDEESYDYTGIVYDVSSTSSGFRFFIQTGSGESFRCFSYNEPTEIGYYGIRGSFSEDGSMFFISSMHCLDA